MASRVAFYNPPLPELLLFAALHFRGLHALVTACHAQAHAPWSENAMILVRLLAVLRRRSPGPASSSAGTAILLPLKCSRCWPIAAGSIFIFGLWQCRLAPAGGAHHAGGARALPAADRPRPGPWRRLPPAAGYEEFSYAAASWSQPWRVIVKAEVMAAGDNPRFVVSLEEDADAAAGV